MYGRAAQRAKGIVKAAKLQVKIFLNYKGKRIII
jgi:hypothetical protein